jgi:serine/threonine protein phosphatase PrpC
MTSLTLRCAARTDVGRVRSNNEDSVFASPRLIAVADGVGGAAAGEVASRTVIDAIVHLDKSLLEDPLETALERSVTVANQTLAFITSCRPALRGMSTTLTAVALHGDLYAIANIGDSRAYLLRDGALRQLTRDDSYVQELIDGGHITAAEARDHPHRSVVMQALDGGGDRRPTITREQARPGDRVLVCSDGLSDLVDDDALEAALHRPALADAADTLIALALEAGGRDNVSVAVADVAPAGDPADGWTAAEG